LGLYIALQEYQLTIVTHSCRQSSALLLSSRLTSLVALCFLRKQRQPAFRWKVIFEDANHSRSSHICHRLSNLKYLGNVSVLHLQHETPTSSQIRRATRTPNDCLVCLSSFLTRQTGPDLLLVGPHNFRSCDYNLNKLLLSVLLRPRTTRSDSPHIVVIKRHKRDAHQP
jgi:hypothetical protein